MSRIGLYVHECEILELRANARNRWRRLGYERDLSVAIGAVLLIVGLVCLSLIERNEP